MDKNDVSRFILAQAIMVEVEGMKASNLNRISKGGGVAWFEVDFKEKADELKSLVENKER